MEKNGKLVLKELEGLPLTAEDLFAEPGGNILFTMGQEDGILYEWDREDVGVRPLLRWQDVDVLPYEVRAVAPIGEGRLILLSSGTDSGGMFVLRKMSVEELPKKETVVLASLYPDTQLLQTVRKFNQLSNEYRVVVERYGATGYRNGMDDDTDAAYRDAVNRLDAALVSSDPPDMLDLNDMDIRKYTDKEALEDLAPRLEEMGIYKEDYLENVWEGFTVGGKLVCLPSEVWDYAWLEQYTRVPEDILLVREDWYFRCFYSALEIYTQFGEDIRFLGTPTMDGEEIGYSCIPSELVDQVTDILEGIDFSPERSVERQIKRIVKEEAASYYDGTKTLEEVSGIIQSRVQILVQENLN